MRNSLGMILIHINKAIYIGNYLEGGLTNKCRKHNIALSVVCMHRAEVFMEPDLKIRYRIKGRLQYIVYGRFAGVKVVHSVCKSRHKILAVVYIPGDCSYIPHGVWHSNSVD